MKSFLIGALGSLILLIAAAIIIPQYADYRARAETDAWLTQLAPVQASIEGMARQQGLSGLSGKIPKPELTPANASIFNIADNGEILIKGGRDGQMLMLIPAKTGNGFSWHCVGGPDKDIPRKCR